MIQISIFPAKNPTVHICFFFVPFGDSGPRRWIIKWFRTFEFRDICTASESESKTMKQGWGKDIKKNEALVKRSKTLVVE